MPNAHLPIRSRARIAVLALAAFAATAWAQSPAPPRGSAATAPPRGSTATAPARTGTAAERSVPIDRVIAIVNDEALTQYDVGEQKRVVLNQMKA